MNKIQNKLPHTNKTIKIMLTISIILFVIIWGTLNYKEFNVVEMSNEEVISCLPTKDDVVNSTIENISFNNDGIDKTIDYIYISGNIEWIGHDTSNNCSIYIVLQNADSEKFYRVPTMIEERTDVTESINDGINYNYSGFEVNIPYSSDINPNLHDYNIFGLIIIDDHQILAPFNTSLYKWGK